MTGDDKKVAAHLKKLNKRAVARLCRRAARRCPRLQPRLRRRSPSSTSARRRRPDEGGALPATARPGNRLVDLAPRLRPLDRRLLRAPGRGRAAPLLRLPRPADRGRPPGARAAEGARRGGDWAGGGAGRPATLLPLAAGVPGGLGPAGGFDVVLGNPPWERVKLAGAGVLRGARAGDRAAPKRRRGRDDPGASAGAQSALFDAFQRARHMPRPSAASSTATAGRFPLRRGDVNTYSALRRAVARGIGPNGRAGVIVPDRHRHRRHEQALLRLAGRAWTPGEPLRLREPGGTLPRRASLVQVLPPDDDRTWGRAGVHRRLFPAPAGGATRGRPPLHPDRGGDRPPQPEHAHLPGLPHRPRRGDHQADLPGRAGPGARGAAGDQPLGRDVQAHVQ
ncbi:MAG: hypothetical protein KatS3mg061_1866 [Dehalococcoidia bacterium]|nr:MAG: hypothetical protein KatS3mg061_1866 [Dehalococcoidia bacterium]